MPEPASSTMRWSSAGRTSTQEVFPPYRTVAWPAAASDPRTPHSRTFMLEGLSPIFARPEDRDGTGQMPRLPDQREGRDRDPALAAIKADDRKRPMVFATI